MLDDGTVKYVSLESGSVTTIVDAELNGYLVLAWDNYASFPVTSLQDIGMALRIEGTTVNTRVYQIDHDGFTMMLREGFN